MLGDSDQSGLFIRRARVGDGTVHASLFVHDGAGYIEAREKAPTPLNRPVHLAGLYDGKSEIRFYVDGKLQQRIAMRGPYKPSPSPFLIGADPQGTMSVARFFTGAISEARISKVARYDKDFTPQVRHEPDVETILLYHLDEGTGDVAHDATGHGYDGKIVAAKWSRLEPAPAPLAKLDFPDIKTPRELAEWTLRVGGKVNAGSGGVYLGVTAEQIAAKDFKLTGVRYDKLKAIDDDAIAHMVRWPLPATIGLIETGITDAGLRQLAALKHGSLSLAVEGTNVTGAGFDAFAGRTFTALTVSGCLISREGWTRIGELKLSGSLYAGNGKLTDDPLIELIGRQPDLVTLYIDRTPVTDAALELISRLPKLGLLVVNGTGVTDAALAQLEKTKTLTVLRAMSTKVTAAGVAKLQKALPGCKIEWNGAANSQPSAPGSPAPPPAVAPFDAQQAKAHQTAWATHLGTTVEQTNTLGMKLVLIPPGEFLMGSTPEQNALGMRMAEDAKLTPVDYTWGRLKEEGPQHRVTLTKPSWLGTTEVTIGQFKKFVEATKHVTEAEQFGSGNDARMTPDEKVTPEKKKMTWRRPGYAVDDDSPVTQVTWNDDVQFCNWLSDQEKLKPCYRQDDKEGLGSAGVRHGLPPADRSRMGICLPGRHDHAVLIRRRPGDARQLRLVRQELG